MIACYTNDKSKLPKEKATLSFCPKGGWWWIRTSLSLNFRLFFLVLVTVRAQADSICLGKGFQDNKKKAALLLINH